MSKQIFYQGQPGATSGVLVASASATRTIDAATICNPSAGAETFTLYLVQDGDSAADDVILYHEKSVASGETLSLPEIVNQCIPRGATIEGLASSATSLTLTISGRSE